MTSPEKLQEKFWLALKEDMTVMLGLNGVEDNHARPMTAQFEGRSGPIWFFTSTETAIYQNVGAAIAPPFPSPRRATVCSPRCMAGSLSTTTAR